LASLATDSNPRVFTALSKVFSEIPLAMLIGSTIMLSGSVLATSSISIPPFLLTINAGLWEVLSSTKAKYNYLLISTPSCIKTAFTKSPSFGVYGVTKV